MAAYPSILDSFPGTSTTGTTQQSDATDDHALQHRVAGSALGTIEQVLGTTNGTAVLQKFAAGDFAVRINTGGTLQQTLIGGTWNNGIVGTPSVNGGTIGTALVQGGTVAGAVGTATTNNLVANWIAANNGTSINIGSAAAPTVGQVPMATNGSAATWQAPMNFNSTGTQAAGTTASVSYINLAGGSLTFNPSRAVTLQAYASGRMANNSGSQSSYVQLLINGTAQQVFSGRINTATFEQAWALMGQASLNSGLGTVSLQYKVDAGTVTIDNSILQIMYV